MPEAIPRLESAAVFAYGPQGSLRGTVVSDAPEAYEWTDRTYRRYREAAVPVDVPPVRWPLESS